MAKTMKSFEIAIDYPQSDEKVVPGHYAVRISGTPQTEVEISINGGQWEACRPGAGFYWYDWLAKPGNAKIVARYKVSDKEWKKSKERKVVV